MKLNYLRDYVISRALRLGALAVYFPYKSFLHSAFYP